MALGGMVQARRCWLEGACAGKVVLGGGVHAKWCLVEGCLQNGAWWEGAAHEYRQGCSGHEMPGWVAG